MYMSYEPCYVHGGQTSGHALLAFYARYERIRVGKIRVQQRSADWYLALNPKKLDVR